MAWSYCRVDRDAVVIRRWPRREQRFPLLLVDRFDVVQKDGGRGAVYDCLVLFLKDGSTVATSQQQSADSDHDETKVDGLRLNNELARFRSQHGFDQERFGLDAS